MVELHVIVKLNPTRQNPTGIYNEWHASLSGHGPYNTTLVGQAEASLRNLSAGKRAAPNDDRRRGGKSKIHGLRIFKSKGSGTLGYVYVASMEKWFFGLPNFYRKRKKIPTNPLTCFSAEFTEKYNVFLRIFPHKKKKYIKPNMRKRDCRKMFYLTTAFPWKGGFTNMP